MGNGLTLSKADATSFKESENYRLIAHSSVKIIVKISKEVQNELICLKIFHLDNCITREINIFIFFRLKLTRTLNFSKRRMRSSVLP